MRHFLAETDFSLDQAAEVFALAAGLKEQRGREPQALQGQTWGMLFSKSSTRTRVSFEVGIGELGGRALFLSQQNLQLARGESIADTARVLSRYVHGLIIRTGAHETIETFAREGSVPVVNALTDSYHPCQLYSDLFTAAERWASNGDPVEALRGRKVAYFGDCGSNMAQSWAVAAAMFGMELVLAGPEEYQPGGEVQRRLNEHGLAATYLQTQDVAFAASGADILYTDVFVSMGNEDEATARKERLAPFSVTAKVAARAKADHLFMHCLPAHIGEEVAEDVFRGPNSIVYDQAENRLHTQKAILSLLARLNA